MGYDKYIPLQATFILTLLLLYTYIKFEYIADKVLDIKNSHSKNSHCRSYVQSTLRWNDQPGIIQETLSSDV